MKGKFSTNILDKNRLPGFYWVRIKRTQLWCVGYYHSSYSFWEMASIMRFDNRSGYDMVYEERLEAPVYVQPLVIRRTKHKPIVPVRIKVKRRK